MEEYFLIIWNDSNETNFILLPMVDFDYANNIKKVIFDKKVLRKEVDKIIESIRDKSIDGFAIGKYDDFSWPFSEYNIKHIINIPEFGY